jgi:basic membrane lipoprotein Med (substrate-binding protein (PBP1-ABC) superfamily)
MHQFYTITERRDDPRITRFTQFAEAAGATSVLVITRPAHVAPDQSQWAAINMEVIGHDAAAANAAQQRNYALAQEQDDLAKAARQRLQQLAADSAKWLSDALELATTAHEAKASGFVVMPVSQWAEATEWSPAAFLAQVNNIEKLGIAGNKFSTPLTRRIFVPLCQFDAAQAASKAPATTAAPDDVTSAILNRPATAPTQTDPAKFTPTQNVMLSQINEAQRKVLISYLGWDRKDKPRHLNTAAVNVGMSAPVFKAQLTRIRAALSQIDMNLDQIYAAAGGPTAAEEAS